MTERAEILDVEFEEQAHTADSDQHGSGIDARRTVELNLATQNFKPRSNLPFTALTHVLLKTYHETRSSSSRIWCKLFDAGTRIFDDLEREAPQRLQG
jgi:hypothetical protein